MEPVAFEAGTSLNTPARYRFQYGTSRGWCIQITIQTSHAHYCSNTIQIYKKQL